MKKLISLLLGNGDYVRKFNIPRIIVCLTMGVISSVLFWISVVYFTPVLLLIFLITMISATIVVLQTSKIYAWVYNIISYVLGLVLSFAVEIGLNFIHILYNLRFSDNEMSYSDWFGVGVIGIVYIFAYFLGVIGSYIITRKRIDHK